MEQSVFVIDDDEEMRGSMRILLESLGYRVETFPSALGFLDATSGEPAGCVITDVRMPGMDGLAFQRSLRAAELKLPVIFVSGYADVALGVTAMREGAYAFLTKPFREQELLEAVGGAMALERSSRAEWRDRAAMGRAFAALDDRERAIMTDVANGTLNKVIAVRLGLSEVTIKVLRARMMRKMGVTSTAQLARIAERLGIR